MKRDKKVIKSPHQIVVENSSTIRGILIYLINFIVTPSHFDSLMSVTIEGVFVENSKNFIDDPLKTLFKSPLLLREHKKIKKVLSFTPTLWLLKVRYY